MNSITKKITDNNDKIVIFYSDWCGYSKNALAYLKQNNISFKGYNIDNIKGGINKVLDELVQSSQQTKFPPNYTTRPLVFYKGKFIGGNNELVNFNFNKN